MAHFSQNGAIKSQFSNIFLGKGNRRVGMYIRHTGFNSAGRFDDFAYRDWVDAA